MTTQHKKTLASILTLCIIMVLPMLATAQIEGTPGVPDAPIDGGLSLLVAAGVGYGAKKLKERRNLNSNQINSKK